MNSTPDTSSSWSTLPPPGDVTKSLGEQERLTQMSHMLDVTVWMMIFCIFIFFFIIIVAVLCMQWLERRSKKKKQKEQAKNFTAELRSSRRPPAAAAAGVSRGGGGSSSPYSASYSNPALHTSASSLSRY
ncbi:hypothetical protein Hamer_G025045 [Homarus americanus]|uniref:Uncharacterized protein n=1 Tax=Homarus americanus TaxID=6706 RepID=A0A8J5TJF4_HOMAM|nr:hypothetical protein Hamer_G025045 [Homarus americanus]